MDGDEEITLLFDHPKEDLTIWYWESSGGSDGFIRDDSTGYTAIGKMTGEDERTLAAWNCDFDIRILKNCLSEEELSNALADAKKNNWGFDDDGNQWDDNDD